MATTEAMFRSLGLTAIQNSQKFRVPGNGSSFLQPMPRISSPRRQSDCVAFPSYSSSRKSNVTAATSKESKAEKKKLKKQKKEEKLKESGEQEEKTQQSPARVRDEGATATDYTSVILESSPSLVEPRFLVNGQLYTSSELKERNQPPVTKLLRIASKSLSRVTEKAEETATAAATKKTAVHLNDLLKPFRNKLYVPEEVFLEGRPDSAQFEKEFRSLPDLKLDQFLKYTKAGIVKMVISRSESFPGVGLKQAYIVRLNPIPGEKSVQCQNWAMALTPPEARRMLLSYSGPIMEAEGEFTELIAAPPEPPHPVAATISSRIVSETVALAAFLASVASLASTLASALLSFLTAAFRFSSVNIVWPLSKPILFPLLGVAAPFALLAVLSVGVAIQLSFAIARFFVVAIGKVVGFVAAVGLGGIWRVTCEVLGAVFSSTMASSLQTLFAMFAVFGVMAALAKFTLTRRTRDFTKWDIWQAIEFGQSKADARVEGMTGVRFADVAGIDDAVKELQELVAYLKDPLSFNSLGTKPPHGVLLEGPPGCGKTLLAKAIAGEAGVPFYQMAGSEFTEILVGIGAARVRDLFKRAKVNKPSVVFIDEVDALGAARLKAGQGGGDDSSTQERETTLNQLLVELDGFDTGQGVIFLAATNRVDMLDPALMRPGRFDRKIKVKPAGPVGRYEILKVHSRNMRLEDSVDLLQVAKNLPGWSGAKLAQVMQESAVLAVQRGGVSVNSRDIDRALDRLILGLSKRRFSDPVDRPSLVRRLAVHELGITMTAMLLTQLEGLNIEPVQRLSVLPHGKTLSRSVFDKIEDNGFVLETRKNLINRLKVYLAGRAAEELLFGRDTSTYTSQYLADASWMAYKLVTIWHMGEKVAMRGTAAAWMRPTGFTGPPLVFESHLYDNYFFDDLQIGGVSDDDIERMSRELLNDTYADTVALLERYKAALVKSVHVLVEVGELYADELQMIIDAYPPGTSVEAIDQEEEIGQIPEWARKTFKESIKLRESDEANNSNFELQIVENRLGS